MAHIHIVDDYDRRFVIDPITRKLTNQTPEKNTLVQNDHNSERFTFELPRIIEGHDMCTCNSVQVHYINIDSVTKAQSAGVYQVDDLRVDPENDNVVVCSWLVSQNATKHKGLLSFVIRFVCTIDGNIDYAWNTAVCSDIVVSDGIYNSDVVMEEYSDVLAEFETRITALERGGVVKTVNGVAPDDNGNVEITIPEPSDKPNVEVQTGDWEMGNIAGEGVEYARNDRIRSVDYLTFNSDKVRIVPSAGYAYSLHDYDSNKAWLSGSPEWIAAETEHEVSADHFYRLNLKRTDDGSMTVDEGANVAVFCEDRYTLPVATSDALGGIKADPAEAADTQPVRIGEDGKLYTAAGSGHGETVDSGGWEVLNTLTVAEDTAEIHLTQSDDGEPYNHSKLLVAAQIPASQASYATHKVNGVSANSGKNIIPGATVQQFFWSGEQIGAAETWWSMEIDAIGDCAIASNYNVNTNGYGSSHKAVGRAWFYQQGGFEKITSLTMSYFNTPIPANSKFMILGRR